MSRLFNLEWEPDNDTWYTPRYIFDALDIQFDIDVAAPPDGVPWVPAKRWYCETDDGLQQPWVGTVWCNPPYSNPKPWVCRLLAHGDGIALLPSDTSLQWTQDALGTADAVCFVAGRLRFVRDSASTSARFPSMLIAYGERCAKALRNCELGVVF